MTLKRFVLGSWMARVRAFAHFCVFYRSHMEVHYYDVDDYMCVRECRTCNKIFWRSY